MTHQTFIIPPIATAGDSLHSSIPSGGLNGAAVRYFLAKLHCK